MENSIISKCWVRLTWKVETNLEVLFLIVITRNDYKCPKLLRCCNITKWKWEGLELESNICNRTSLDWNLTYYICDVAWDLFQNTHSGRMLFLLLDFQSELEAVQLKSRDNSCQLETLTLDLHFLLYSTTKEVII